MNSTRGRRLVLITWMLFDASSGGMGASNDGNLGKQSSASAVRARRRLVLAALSDDVSEHALESRHASPPEEKNVFVHSSSANVTVPPTRSPGPDASTDAPARSPTRRPTAEAEDEGPPTSLLPTTSPDSSERTPTSSPDETGTKAPSGPTSSPRVPTMVPDTSSETEAPTSSESLQESDAPSSSSTANETATLEPTSQDDDDGENSTSVTEAPTPAGVNGTFESVEEFLFETLSDDGSLTQEGTPQNQALTALLDVTEEGGLDPNDPTDQREITQRYSLNTLYFATGGANWAGNDLWTTSALPCGEEGGEGPWLGIQCDTTTRSVVEFVSLPGNDLLGSIPSEIRGLSGLKTLNLFDNQLSGSIPSAIGDLTMLTVLEAGSNFFTSPLPSEIGKVTLLDMLSLFSNLISGEVPSEIGQLQSLRGLSLEGNYLTGTLPPQLFDLTGLGEYTPSTWMICPRCMLVSYID
jgi:hypothetical protein